MACHLSGLGHDGLDCWDPLRQPPAAVKVLDRVDVTAGDRIELPAELARSVIGRAQIDDAAGFTMTYTEVSSQERGVAQVVVEIATSASPLLSAGVLRPTSPRAFAWRDLLR